jgi:hypothetical protein
LIQGERGEGEDKTVNMRRIIGTSLRLRYAVTAYRFKVFKCLTVERGRREGVNNGIK